MHQTPDKTLFLDQKLCFAVYSTSLAMTQKYKPLLEKIGLTYPRYLIMLVLWEKDSINVKELANRLQQNSGSLSPVLKSMQNDGLLSRQRDPLDERNLVLLLTKKGQELKKQAKLIDSKFGSACGVSNEEAMILLNLLIPLRVRLM